MKLIHCADIHLDAPMGTHLTSEKASMRNTELTRTFVRLTEYAARNGVAAVLISGDLFDGERVKRRTVNAVLDAMGGTPTVTYLYLPGNHDCASGAFADRTLPENLKLFDRTWKTYPLGEVAVSGAMCCAENADSLYATLPTVTQMTHIVMLHGPVDSSPEGVRLNLLKNRGIAYLALGHIHSFASYPLAPGGIYCYPGCLEGRGFDECGPKGFALLTVEKGRIRNEFVPFCCRQLHRVPVDISGAGTNAEVVGRLQQAVAELPQGDMAELVLTGSVDPAAGISAAYLQNYFNDRFFFCEVRDKTLPALKPEQYLGDASLKGMFVRLVMESRQTEAEKAAILRAGLQALMGEEITL